MTVSFAVAAPFREALLEYGRDGTFGSTVPVETRSVAGVQTRYGHAPLTGLDAGTTYSYRVRLDGKVGDPGSLTTARRDRSLSRSRLSGTRASRWRLVR